MRLREKWNVQIDNLEEKDCVVKLKGVGRMRVVKLVLDSGEQEVLITNLYEIAYKDFKALYHKRWGIETKYDVVKNKLALENFSGYSKNVVLQDFWATMALGNMCAVARNEANRELEEKKNKKGLKYEYVPNVNQLIGSVKDILVGCFLKESEEEMDEELRRMSEEILRALVPVRPGRSNPRRSPARSSKFHHNRKLNI
jgi:hypothetical protein